MATNPNFCKPIDNGARLQYAPVMMFPNPAPPTEAEYNAAGFYRKAITPPSPPDGKVVGRVTYAVADNAVVAEYEYVDAPPPPPRTFSKYRLVSALMAANLWTGVKAWIESTKGAYDLYLAAEDISEDEPLLAQGIAALKSELGITDEQVESILAAATIGGVA